MIVEFIDNKPESIKLYDILNISELRVKGLSWVTPKHIESESFVIRFVKKHSANIEILRRDVTIEEVLVFLTASRQDKLPGTTCTNLVMSYFRNLALQNELPVSHEKDDINLFLNLSESLREINSKFADFNGLSASTFSIFFMCDTFKDTVQKVTGSSSPRMIKLVYKYLVNTNRIHMDKYDYHRHGDSTRHFRNTGYCLESEGVYRRDIIYFHSLVIISSLCVLLPLNYIYDLLEREEGRAKSLSALTTEAVSFLRENYEYKKIYSFLTKDKFDIHNLTDVAKQYSKFKSPESIPDSMKYKYPNGLRLPKTKTLEELHDRISIQYREIQAEADNRPISYSDKELKLEELELENNIKLILPKETKTLVQWGTEMNNCIASYGDQAANKSALLIGVEVNKCLKYNIEVRYSRFDGFSDNVTINQFYGYQNSTPEDKDEEIYVRKIITETLKTLNRNDRIVDESNSTLNRV